MARKFLYVIAALIVFALGTSLAYRLWGQQLLAATMVPRTQFTALPPLPAAAYAKADMWFARPDKRRDNPALWRPADDKTAPAPIPAAIFFIHPTSYNAPFNRAKWNMPLGDAAAETLAKRFIAGQASAFNAAGQIWAPRYRQAHIGAFFSDGTNAQLALDAAYGDVAQAFDAFVAANPTGPILLVAHSQGSLHLLRLLRDKVAGKPIAQRIVAVYAVGWPISMTADLPALGLPACDMRGQAGCILSWQSFAEPADPSALLANFDVGTGFTGAPRKGSAMLCVNPLTGSRNGAGTAKQNLGTLDERIADAAPAGLIRGAVPARCGGRGLLLIGDAPTLGPYVLPGNNYHVYDYGLFWANIRRDAGERLITFLKKP